MPLIGEKDRKVLRQEFAQMTEPVRLIVFTQDRECQYCKETRQIAQELTELSDKLSLEVYDFVADKEQVANFRIDKIPAIAVVRGGAQPKDYGIRFYGIPSGYEFGTLVEDILMVSAGQSGLTEQTKKAIASIRKPAHLQVFVTPTCPYCPQAVRLAHQLALESDLITADMVEAIEFPHLANKYDVMGVPRTVINDARHIEGAAPEAMVVQELLAAVQG
jgi:glutaredoxin-like protein